MIEDIFRSLVKEELAVFSKEILNYTKKDRESYYGRTVLTIKEASKHFRTSPATIYSLIKDEGMPHFKIQSRFYIVLEDKRSIPMERNCQIICDTRQYLLAKNTSAA